MPDDPSEILHSIMTDFARDVISEDKLQTCLKLASADGAPRLVAKSTGNNFAERATSLYVAWDDAESIEQYFNALSDGGEIMMPLGECPFSKKFGWIRDRFGVSWQLAAT